MKLSGLGMHPISDRTKIIQIVVDRNSISTDCSAYMSNRRNDHEA